MRKAALVYVAAALAYTWPLALHPATRLAAPVGPGDPFLNLWALGWGMDTIVRRPADVLTGRVFDANIFHPAGATLAYSDHLLPQSAALAPLYAATSDAVLCYNVLFLASLVLSGIAMHAFVRAVVGSTGGAYLAGIAWAFWPYHFAHLLHLQLQALYFLPLAFLSLHRLIAGHRRRDAVGLGATTALQALSSAYYGVIGSVGLVVAAAALAIGVGRWRSAVLARRLALAALVGALLVAPVAWVYWQLGQEEGFARNLYQAARNAATAGSYLQAPPGNLVYGRTGLLASGGVERDLFPGLVLAGLACAGIVLGRRGDATPLVLAMTSVAAAGFALSLGPDGLRDVYALAHRHIFGFDVVRAPARFSILVTFGLATLAAVGWRELRRRRRGAAAALLAFAACEYINVPLPLAPAPPRATDVGQWLRHEAGGGAVVHLPIGFDVESTPVMVQSLEHRRPIVNGYSGQRPDFYMPLVETLGTFPGDEALLALHEIGVRFVVAPVPAREEHVDPVSPLVERARFHGSVIYELQWTPEAVARLAAESPVDPPPAGRLRFSSGERARYAAYWDGGMELPAGEVTLSVEDPPFTFAGRLETAPWMARFFEARDEFRTRTDERLLPRVHDRAEGGATRTFLYEHDEGVVRIGRDAAHAAGVEGVSLPLAPEARDAVSAIFFARTLPLADGDRYLIPVNEAGRSLVVELVVAGRETIAAGGGTTPAIRLEPELKRRTEHRQPVRAVLWLADDERRVPLVLELDAPFGRIRLELIEYRP